MQMREAAEKILFAESLDEKLQLAPEVASDGEPGKAIIVPDAPGRPEDLKMSPKGVKASFPGVNRMDDDHERGKMMHFLANHELMAAELMALVLLKFPDAPKEYRAGVYEAMREEQMHTLMYMRRMRECGIYFGELPVNDYFWKLVAPMQTPMDFVTRLNLTFEQSNLDFSKHYAKLFRQVGDMGTGAVLEKIYLDEIGHVGHGVKWFRKWKKQGQSDWQAFKTSLTFPLAPAKAKGMAPYNAEGRRLAGLDEDFINQLEVCEQSRGRTPVVHWFNPNAESEVLAKVSGRAFLPNPMERAMECDLEMLMLSWCRRDDLILMRKPPSTAHLARLKKAGFDLPEIVSAREVEEVLLARKIGGLRPWAWSPHAAACLKPYRKNIPESVPWQWQGEVNNEWFSKEVGVNLNKMLDLHGGCGVFCKDEESAWSMAQKLLSKGDVLLKSAYACAGRGHKRMKSGAMTEGAEVNVRGWMKKTIASHGGVVVEPWLDRVLDFSALYEMDASGEVNWVGMSEMENDASGRFLGTRIYAKWGSGLDAEVAEFLFREVKMRLWYQEKIPVALSKLLDGYVGPVGVDAMVYRKADGALALRHVIELNVRMTMGRVALELHKKSKPSRGGRFQILRKNNLSDEDSALLDQTGVGSKIILLNDPEFAQEFLALWQVL